MNKKFKALIAGAMAVASAATMVISASAYRPKLNGIIDVKGNKYVLSANTIGNFAEINEIVMEKYEKCNINSFMYDDVYSSGSILCVFGEDISLQEAYDWTSKVKWTDSDQRQIYPCLMYHSQIKRYYLAIPSMNSEDLGVAVRDYWFRFNCAGDTVKETRQIGDGKYSRSVTLTFDVAVKSSYCLPNIKVTGKDSTGNALKHYLALEDGRVVSKWYVQCGASGRASYTASLYDTTSPYYTVYSVKR